MTRVLVLNGPNLGRLGSREPEVYGNATHAELVAACTRERARARAGRSRCARPTTRPSWCGWLHEAADGAVPVVLNPAAFTHYSYALRDACAARTAPLVEVHLSNPAAREAFRHTSVVAGVAGGAITGFGLDSYRLALRAVPAWAGTPMTPTSCRPDTRPAGTGLRVLAAEDGAEAALVTRLVNVRYLTGFTGSNAALLVTADQARAGDRRSLHDAGRRSSRPTWSVLIDRECPPALVGARGRGRRTTAGVRGPRRQRRGCTPRWPPWTALPSWCRSATRSRCCARSRTTASSRCSARRARSATGRCARRSSDPRRAAPSGRSPGGWRTGWSTSGADGRRVRDDRRDRPEQRHPAPPAPPTARSCWATCSRSTSARGTAATTPTAPAPWSSAREPGRLAARDLRRRTPRRSGPVGTRSRSAPTCARSTPRPRRRGRGRLRRGLPARSRSRGRPGDPRGPDAGVRATGRLAGRTPVTVEPGVYLPGRGGVRIEDTLVVGEETPELLTTTSKDLLVL